MKVELVYDLPLADRLAHRQNLLMGLVDLLGSKAVRLSYIGTNPLDYLRAWRRNSGADTPRNAVSTIQLARHLGVRARVGGAPFEEETDIGILFSSRFLPLEHAERPRFGTIAAHYARLPDLPGRDALLWSRLLGVPLEVSLFQLSRAGIDRGPVLKRLAVDGMNRAAAQRTAANGLLHLVRDIKTSNQLPDPIHPGSTAPTLPRLGARLRAKALLR